MCVLAKLIVTAFHHLKEYQKPETIMLIMIAYRPALDVQKYHALIKSLLFDVIYL